MIFDLNLNKGFLQEHFLAFELHTLHLKLFKMLKFVLKIILLPIKRNL